ncbi:MAG: hypothetical protein ACYDCL_23565 [Myxococcales bacterium]
MNARMILGLALGTVLSGEAAVASAQPMMNGTAVVVVDRAGGLDPTRAHTLVQLTEERLRQDGVNVVDVPALQPPQDITPQLGSSARASGADRLFVIQALPLGAQVIEQLDERSLDGQRVLFSAKLEGTLDDSPAILPRLVDSVLWRKPVAETATFATVVPVEARPIESRSGQGHFVMALPFGLTSGGTSGAVGLSLGFLYEIEHWGFGFDGLLAGANNNVIGLVDVHGRYYFLDGVWSPYADLGAGFMGVQQTSGNSPGGLGAGATAEVGVELLRLNHLHIEVGLQGLFPLFLATDDVGKQQYLPAGLLKLGLAF